MKKLITLVVATALSIVGAELLLRWFWHNPFRNEAPDHLIKISMQHPRTDHIVPRDMIEPGGPVRLRADERGYLLPAAQHSQPDVTIAFLGGSTTECMAVQEPLRFPALVSTLLSERGIKANTLNAGRSGNSIHDSLNVFINQVVTDRPDFVVVMHVSNDVGILRSQSSYESRMGGPVSTVDVGKWVLQIASGELYLAALGRFVLASNITLRPADASRDWRHDPSVLDGLPVEPYRQRLRAFVRVARSFEIEPILMTEPFSGSTNHLTPEWVSRTGQDRFNGIVHEVGQEEGVLVIDLVRYLQERVPDWSKPMEIFYDAIHVTDKGSRAYADHIVERLVPVIQTKRQALLSQSASTRQAYVVARDP